MNRLQWLAEVEIRKLEELYNQPSPEEGTTADDAEAVRTETRKVRHTRRRDR